MNIQACSFYLTDYRELYTIPIIKTLNHTNQLSNGNIEQLFTEPVINTIITE